MKSYPQNTLAFVEVCRYYTFLCLPSESKRVETSFLPTDWTPPTLFTPLSLSLSLSLLLPTFSNRFAAGITGASEPVTRNSYAQAHRVSVASWREPRLLRCWPCDWARVKSVFCLVWREVPSLHLLLLLGSFCFFFNRLLLIIGWCWVHYNINSWHYLFKKELFIQRGTIYWIIKWWCKDTHTYIYLRFFQSRPS